jgi:hypothetical protein
MKKPLYIFILASMVMASCTKDDMPTPTPARPDKFADIKVADNFKWETGRMITVKIKGNATYTTVINTLSLLNEKGEVFTSVLHNMNNQAEIKVEVPAHTKTIKMQYGSIVKEAPVSDVVNFDFLPTLSNEE